MKKEAIDQEARLAEAPDRLEKIKRRISPFVKKRQEYPFGVKEQWCDESCNPPVVPKQRNFLRQ